MFCASQHTEWTNNKKVRKKEIRIYKRMKIKWKHKKKHYKRLFPSYIEDCGDTQKEFPTLFKKGGGCGAGKWFLTGVMLSTTNPSQTPGHTSTWNQLGT